MARKNLSQMRKYDLAQSQAVPLIAWLNDARKNGEQSYRRLSKLYDLLLGIHSSWRSAI